MDYHNIISFFSGSFWGIIPDKMDFILSFMNKKIDTGMGAVDFEAAKKTTKFRVESGNIAVLPLYGVVSQRVSMMSDFSGGTSTDIFGARFDSLVNDDSISAIVIDVDSPGGNVFGVQELADKMFAARGKKPVIAVVNSLMASAAYWIGSAADEIVMTPGGEVGSIGVMTLHTDQTAAAEQAGVKNTIIRAGKYKVESNPYEPLGDDAKDYIQSQVDARYADFIATVARNRGKSDDKVEKTFGQGRLMDAKHALSVGMIDKIGTLEQVLTDLRPKRNRNANRRASINISSKR